MNRNICIDFDKTICNEDGSPTYGVKRALQKIKSRGFLIFIYTCRTNNFLNKHSIDKITRIKQIEKYLNKYKIPFDVVLNNDKPIAFAYVDDRAIGFRGDWSKVLREIAQLE